MCVCIYINVKGNKNDERMTTYNEPTKFPIFGMKQKLPWRLQPRMNVSLFLYIFSKKGISPLLFPFNG